MTRSVTKISLILGFLLLEACSPTRRLTRDELWLMDNEIIVDEQERKDAALTDLLIQKPNTKLPVVGVPLGVLVHNLAGPNPQERFTAWLEAKPKRTERLQRLISAKQLRAIDSAKINFNQWLKNTGSAPVVIDTTKAKRSLDQLKKYFYNQGYFNIKGRYSVLKDSTKKNRGSIRYTLNRNKAYSIGTLNYKIESPQIDSLFWATQNASFIRSGQPYDLADFDNERARITLQMRNSGFYFFDQDYVTFEADTNGLGQRVNVQYIIPNRRINKGDSVATTAPFKQYTINRVRIITDHSPQNQMLPFRDTAYYKGYELYSHNGAKYRSKALTNAMAIVPGGLYSDIDRTVTNSQINELRNFKYPTIHYKVDPDDTTQTGLISSIYLTPRKKYTFGIDLDAYTSTIQQFGIGFSTSFLIRNVFRGAENLEISARGSVGSSKDNAISDSKFFNTSDVGIDARLSIPRLLFPINTQSIIPKYMAPTTAISTGLNSQQNIGLDRQNFNSIYSYRWRPTNTRINTFDLLNLQYVRNLNAANYFNVYRASYSRLNDIAQEVNYPFQGAENTLSIPDETNLFLSSVQDPQAPWSFNPELTREMNAITQRKNRLTENNLILASNFTWQIDNRETVNDNSFTRFQWKAELAGSLLSGLSQIGGSTDASGRQEFFGVAFSQYAKLELDYIRHWDLGSQNVMAFRSFGGWALPFGNSSSIPFTRSYFAGGANDIRGWRAYDLGPGSSGSNLDFNEANFKLSFNLEYRFPIFGGFKGAFFADVGNIWNFKDDVLDPAFQFNGLEDLKELAVASGLGLRYDFGFFVIRFDTGFKTHNPARPANDRWFKEYNFANAVYNIGINYPF